MRLLLVWLVAATATIFSPARAEKTESEVPGFTREVVDSLAERMVKRCESELRAYVKSSDPTETYLLGLILSKSDAGRLALDNFKAFHALERQRALELMVRGDTLITLGDEELITVVWTMAQNYRVIDEFAVKDTRELTPLLDRPAVAQAARDLANAWQDIGDAMVRRSPFLKLLLETLANPK